MTSVDIPGAMRLKEAAGWNQTQADWELLLRMAPDGCWIYEADGLAAGSVTAVRYGLDLAWIGMVLVLPEYRRRGIGRQLLLHAIEACDRLGVRRLALDATEMGRPLYLSLGFVDEEPIERWALDGLAPPNVADRTSTGLELRYEEGLDRQALGVDRRRLVEELAALPGAEAAWDSDGYALSRPGYQARYLGPLTARNVAAARRLCEALLAKHRGERFFFDILPMRDPVAELATSLGFRPLRKLVRMSRPAASRSTAPVGICSAAGFELG